MLLLLAAGGGVCFSGVGVGTGAFVVGLGEGLGGSSALAEVFRKELCLGRVFGGTLDDVVVGFAAVLGGTLDRNVRDDILVDGVLPAREHNKRHYPFSISIAS
jgi:hypothetical protein